MESRVLAAALTEYADRGWSGLTIDAVARRAEVGKSTIYLRWADRDALLADAFSAYTVEIEPVDCGALRADLEALASRLLQFFSQPTGRAALRIFMDVAAGNGRDVSHFAETINEVHRKAALAILERAAARGEVDPGVDARLVVNALYGTVLLEVMMQPWSNDADPWAVVSKVVDFCYEGMTPWLPASASSAAS